MGYWKTLKAIQCFYYWQGMHADIYKYVKECETCRQAKHTNENTLVPTGNYRDPIHPGRVMYVDYIGPLPASQKRKHIHTVVCVDGFSRYVFTKSFIHPTSQNAIDFLEKEVFWKFDTPEELVTDHGKQFTGKAFERFMAKYHIRHSTTGFYHP